MKRHTYLYYWILCLLAWTLEASCSSSTIEEEIPEPDPEQPTPSDKDEYTFSSVEYRKWQSGIFQPWTTADSQETRTIDNMNWHTLSTDYNCTAWGGRIGLQPSSIVGKEGFFRVACCNGRYYLLDPDNGAVILHGIQHVRPGTSTVHEAAFNSKFGSEAKWSEETGKLIAGHHINYISYGSNRIEAFPATMRLTYLHPKRPGIRK